MPRKSWLTGAAIVVTITASVFLLFTLSVPCLILRNGDSGEVIRVFPVQEGDEFSVTFVHSVNKSPVTDVYQIRRDGIYVVRTIYYAFGAGVQVRAGGRTKLGIWRGWRDDRFRFQSPPRSSFIYCGDSLRPYLADWWGGDELTRNLWPQHNCSFRERAEITPLLISFTVKNRDLGWLNSFCIEP